MKEEILGEKYFIMSNRFVVILIACVAIFLGLVFFAKRDAGAPSDSGTATVTNHVSGAGTTGVTLVEYGDFQCPACGGYYPIVKQVKEKYGDQITFQFRHFPIVGIHPNAMSAHRAAEAASRQDKFWEMHDLIYERQSIWTSSKNPGSIFKDYAEELSLNMEQYNNDLLKAEIGDIIQADVQAGKDLNVTSTPSFFLEGKLLENPPRDLEGFSTIIDEAIEAKQ